MPTPYDGKIAVWHVYGGMIGENTISEIASTLHQYAPAVKAVLVKVTDGTKWMGAYEPKPDLAINGPLDIDRWVSALANANLEFHAWAVPTGKDPIVEAQLLRQVCQRPNVKSLILDVEGGSGFFSGGRAAIRPLMVQLRQGLPGTFHIGLSVDPRPNHFSEIFPDEWFPFVNSVHPQVYWQAFQQTPDVALQSAYATWENYGRPIIPVLQAYSVDADSMNRAHKLSTDTYKASALSWYVFGNIGPNQFTAVNVALDGAVPIGPGPLPTPTGSGHYGTEIIVKVNDPSYQEGTYNNIPNPLQSFDDGTGRIAKYTSTNSASNTVWARWDPQLPSAGYWEISTFVPAQHATTNNAHYKINGVVGRTTETEVDIQQNPLDNLWVSLGIYQFSPGGNAGVVFLTDYTGESGQSITFDAIRWRQVVGMNNPPTYLADGFDAPISSIDQRHSANIWPTDWFSSNPYEHYYLLSPGHPAYHTGDDLLAKAGIDATAHQPIGAAASGVVVSAARQTGSWGNVIVIRHDPLISTGQVVYSRYGHVENMQVKPGDRVVRGQYIAHVGNAFGFFVYHLHFDLSPTRILQSQPWDWPGLDKTRLERDYISPLTFITNNRPVKP